MSEESVIASASQWTDRDSLECELDSAFEMPDDYTFTMTSGALVKLLVRTRDYMALSDKFLKQREDFLKKMCALDYKNTASGRPEGRDFLAGFETAKQEIIELFAEVMEYNKEVKE